MILLPFVAAFGLTTNAQLIAAVLGGLVVGAAYWVLGRLPVRPAVRVGTTIIFALGTVFWYASMLGQTWYLAHVVAVGLSLLAVGVARPLAGTHAQGYAGLVPGTAHTLRVPHRLARAPGDGAAG